jgi:multidrug efflux pump subunit AcrA (membrane-fusion protein)
VARVAPDVDERTRTFSVYLDVDNTRHEKPLVPGTFVTAEVRGPTYGDRLLVPRGAIRDGAVLVAAGNVASRRSVRTERLIGDRAMIVGDVHPGDAVIVSHLGQLDNGSPIRLRAVLSGSKQDGGSGEHSGASGLDASSEGRVEGRGSPAAEVGISP